jgi:hypothetical protein
MSIWSCPNCGHINDLSNLDCAKCGFAKPPADKANQTRHVGFEVFRGTLISWQALFASAAELATKIGPENLITISHPQDHNQGVATVWFWKD